MIRKAILFAALFTLAPFSVGAKSLYVNNSGTPVCSDSTSYANNSPSSPWCTLGRAMWGSTNRAAPVPAQAVTAGDTVLVTAGTYSAPDTGTRFGVVFNPVNTGTSEGARIVIKAVGVVELRSTGTSGGPLIGANGKNYVTWDGFYINEANSPQLSGERAMCMFSAANYGLVQNCTLVGLGSDAADANTSAIFFNGSIGSRAYNNTIYNIKATGTNVAAIYTYGATSCIMEHNNIYNSDAALFIKGNVGVTTNTGNVFRFNKAWNLAKFGVRIGGTGGDANANNLIYQNVFYGSPAARILFTSYSSYTGNVFANNTIYNAKSAYIYGSTYSSGTVRYYNNIIHTVATSVAYTEDYTDTYPTDYDFQHNSYYGTPAGNWWVEKDGAAFATWNTWIGAEPWNQDNISPASTNGTNPLFANIAENDFRLCTASGVPHASCSTASPALTLGIDILDLDRDGLTNDTIPAGAYITGTETIGLPVVPPMEGSTSSGGGGGGGCSITGTKVDSVNASSIVYLLLLIAPAILLFVRKLRRYTRASS